VPGQPVAYMKCGGLDKVLIYTPYQLRLPTMHSFPLVTLFVTFIFFAIFSNADTTDTCIFLNNVDLTALLNTDLGISIPDIFGDVTGCLCVSGIDGAVINFPLRLLCLYRITDFINANVETELAVSFVSMISVVDTLTTIVRQSVVPLMKLLLIVVRRLKKIGQ